MTSQSETSIFLKRSQIAQAFLIDPKALPSEYSFASNDSFIMFQETPLKSKKILNTAITRIIDTGIQAFQNFLRLPELRGRVVSSEEVFLPGCACFLKKELFSGELFNEIKAAILEREKNEKLNLLKEFLTNRNLVPLRLIDDFLYFLPAEETKQGQFAKAREISIVHWSTNEDFNQVIPLHELRRQVVTRFLSHIKICCTHFLETPQARGICPLFTSDVQIPGVAFPITKEILARCYAEIPDQSATMNTLLAQVQAELLERNKFDEMVREQMKLVGVAATKWKQIKMLESKHGPSPDSWSLVMNHIYGVHFQTFCRLQVVIDHVLDRENLCNYSEAVLLLCGDLLFQLEEYLSPSEFRQFKIPIVLLVKLLQSSVDLKAKRLSVYFYARQKTIIDENGTVYSPECFLEVDTVSPVWLAAESLIGLKQATFF